MTINLRLIAVPTLLVAMLQVSGCTSRRATVPPGGTYLSTSAGANFDQSVALADDATQNIAQFPLKKAHRPRHNPSLVYVAAGDRGIVTSDNGGESWRVSATPLASISDVVLLTNGTILAAGVDDNGQGFIIRSQNQGQSWEIVLTVPVPVDKRRFQILQNETIASVVITVEVDPLNPDRVYAGTNLGTVLVGEQSGKTWRTLHTIESTRFNPSGTRQNLAIQDLVPSPHRVGEILITTADKSLLRVTSGEQKEVSVPLYIDTPPPFGTGSTEKRKILDIIYSPADPNTLLAASVEGVVVSNNRGETWQQLKLPVETSRGFNNTIVTVSPTNSKRILVGINSVLYRSEDGGSSWNTFDFRLPSHVIKTILINPANPANVLVVTAPIGV